jgi:hypothetical protein
VWPLLADSLIKTHDPAAIVDAAILKAVEEGHDVNEVEGAGNTPLHFACYEGWLEGWAPGFLGLAGSSTNLWPAGFMQHRCCQTKAATKEAPADGMTLSGLRRLNAS